MSRVPPATSLRWDEPEGVEARGTVVVLGGRGEAPAAYARFGRRLAADAYRVRVVSDVTAPGQRTIELARNILREDNVAPTVLLGSDAGAIAALRLAASAAPVAGVIAVGLPGGPGRVAEGVAQLPLRTRSPEHWASLADPAVLDPEALGREIPASLALPDPASLPVPVFALHGADDAVAPLEEALGYYAELPRARLVVVDRGLHDSVNDAAHRAVAATIVLFLEELRNGAPTVARLALSGREP